MAVTFSANNIRWNSITKKLISCSISSSEASRDSFGIVKYLFGRIDDARPLPRTSLPATSAEAVTIKNLANNFYIVPCVVFFI